MSTIREKLTGLLLVCVLVVAITYLSNRISGQLDLTEGHQYTLSKETQGILAAIEEPVQIEFFFSRSQRSLPIQLKNYAARIETLLEQYARQSSGKIHLSVIDPKPGSVEEEAALRYGLSPQQLPDGERWFMGIQISQLDRGETLPLVNLNRDGLLEYDISQLLFRVQLEERPTLGVISTLNLFGDGKSVAPWTVLENINSLYNLETLELDDLVDNTIPEHISALLVVHPSSNNTEWQFAIDQFALSGRPVIIAVDPSSVYARTVAGKQPGVGVEGIYSSDMRRLFSHWGIVYNNRKLVADLEYASTFAPPQQQDILSYPIWLDVRISESEYPFMEGIDELLLPETGFFIYGSSEKLTIEPLFMSSRNSGVIDSNVVPYLNARQMRQQFTPSGERRTLALVIRGTMTTAFPEGMPYTGGDETEAWLHQLNEKEKGRLTESEKPVSIVLIADTDFMFDHFAYEYEQARSQFKPRNNNAAFLMNLVDVMMGSSDLISLRANDYDYRGFEVVRQMRIEAEQRYRKQLEALDEKIQEVEQTLSKLRSEREQQQELVASGELLDSIKEAQVMQARIQSEKRSIRYKLSEDIRRLDRTLAMLNMLVVPLMLGLLGAAYFIRRARRGKD